MLKDYSLTSWRMWIYSLLAWGIVAFGQPASQLLLGVLASICGFAIFWRILLAFPEKKSRFYIATIWFSAIQLIQLSWLLTHPYSYIYIIYTLLALAMGAAFGIVCLTLNEKRLSSWVGLIGIAGAFTLIEWARLFVLSGFPFNPSGLALTVTLWGLQGAALGGIYGLTLWVMLTNLLFLRCWLINRTGLSLCLMGMMVIGPYGYGYWHVYRHQAGVEAAYRDPSTQLRSLVVQTAFPIEENLSFSSFKEAQTYVQNEWGKILLTLQPHLDQVVDLIVLPEYVVPYATYLAVHPYSNVKTQFAEVFGQSAISALPALQEPLARKIDTQQGGGEWLVTNAYYCQAIANLFRADLVAGLQDDQWINQHDKLSYSSGIYFWPDGEGGFRYEKRVLLPVAEYIPFDFCKAWAKDYGITGSFTCGQEAKVFPGSKVPFGISICYEEAFGDLMRENRVNGAELLINLTSDVWFPDSKLPKQHFDHARLRTVESGIPLIRACNTGITSAIDSIGRIAGTLGEQSEWDRQALYVSVPLYHYHTLYEETGDKLVIAFSLISCIFLIPIRKF